MSPIEAAREIQTLLERASGSPVVVRPGEVQSGRAAMTLASADNPAHLLRFKPEFEADLPYLLAFHCGIALRAFQADPQHRFDLGWTDATESTITQLMKTHLRNLTAQIPGSVITSLVSQFCHGLGSQLRSMPIAIRVDGWIANQYPVLAAVQRRVNERELQTLMAALSPQVRSMAPKRVIDASVAMSCAVAKFWAGIWADPLVEVPFVSAGYGKIGNELLALTRTVDPSPNGDREVVLQWAKTLGLSDWYRIVAKP